MPAQNRDLVLRIRAIDRVSKVIDGVSEKFPKLTQKVKSVNEALSGMDARFGGAIKSIENFGKKTEKFGKKILTNVALPTAAVGALAVKSFADFESGLVAVGREGNLSGDALNQFGESVREMSTRLPFSTKELLAVARSAGEVGVRGDDLLTFTETIAKFGKVTGVSADEATQSFSQILRLTGATNAESKNLGSAIVELSNQFGVGSKKILSLSDSLAVNLGPLGLTTTQTTGLATALIRMGLDSENAAGAVRQSFLEIDQAIQKGGIEFQAIQKLTGLTGDELRKQFEENAIGVFQKFVKGIGEFEKAGGNGLQLLEAFGLGSLKTSKALIPLTQQSELLTQTLEKSGLAFTQNNALQEASKKSATTLSEEFKILKNTFFLLLETIGQGLAPAVRVVNGLLMNMLNFFKENPTVTKFVGAIALVVSAVGAAAFAIGKFLTFAGPILKVFGLIAGTLGAAVSAKFLLIAGAIGAVIGGVVLLINKWDVLMEKLANTRVGRLFGMLSTRGGGRREDAGADEVLGPSVGARQSNVGAVTQQNKQTLDANLNVNFAQTPRGTRVVPGPGDFEPNINVGFAGAFQ